METELLAKLVNARLQLLTQLRQLAPRQAELVQVGDMVRLISFLAVKQKLLNELQRVERQLDPFREQDPERRVWRSPNDRQRCREEADRCELLLQDILRIERECESALVQRREDTATLLQGTHNAARASQAYSTSVESAGSQFDVSCER